MRALRLRLLALRPMDLPHSYTFPAADEPALAIQVPYTMTPYYGTAPSGTPTYHRKSQHCLWPNCSQRGHLFGRADEVHRHRAKIHVPRLGLSGLCPYCDKPGFEVYRKDRKLDHHLLEAHGKKIDKKSSGLLLTSWQGWTFISGSSDEYLQWYMNHPSWSVQTSRDSTPPLSRRTRAGFVRLSHRRSQYLRAGRSGRQKSANNQEGDKSNDAYLGSGWFET